MVTPVHRGKEDDNGAIQIHGDTQLNLSVFTWCKKCICSVRRKRSHEASKCAFRLN